MFPPFRVSSICFFIFIFSILVTLNTGTSHQNMGFSKRRLIMDLFLWIISNDLRLECSHFVKFIFHGENLPFLFLLLHPSLALTFVHKICEFYRYVYIYICILWCRNLHQNCSCGFSCGNGLTTDSPWISECFTLTAINIWFTASIIIW